MNEKIGSGESVCDPLVRMTQTLSWEGAFEYLLNNPSRWQGRAAQPAAINLRTPYVVDVEDEQCAVHPPLTWLDQFRTEDPAKPHDPPPKVAPGKISEATVRLVAEALVATVREADYSFQAVAATPYGADPYVREFCRIYQEQTRRPIRRLRLKSTEFSPHCPKDDRRVLEISSGSYFEGDRVLVLTDVLAGGKSARESVWVLRKSGLAVIGLLAIIIAPGEATARTPAGSVLKGTATVTHRAVSTRALLRFHPNEGITPAHDERSAERMAS